MSNECYLSKIWEMINQYTMALLHIFSDIWYTGVWPLYYLVVT